MLAYQILLSVCTCKLFSCYCVLCAVCVLLQGKAHQLTKLSSMSCAVEGPAYVGIFWSAVPEEAASPSTSGNYWSAPTLLMQVKMLPVCACSREIRCAECTLILNQICEVYLHLRGCPVHQVPPMLRGIYLSCIAWLKGRLPGRGQASCGQGCSNNYPNMLGHCAEHTE